MEVMNSTTITISERTRRELLKIGAELQLKRERKIDYEEVIEYLIVKARGNAELFRRATAGTGIGSAELQKALREGREEDKRGEEELERHYS